jgi:hypothetical protein
MARRHFTSAFYDALSSKNHTIEQTKDAMAKVLEHIQALEAILGNALKPVPDVQVGLVRQAYR